MESCSCIPYEFLIARTGDLEGIVTDEATAKASSCHGSDKTGRFYSKGIVGVLNKDQIDKYCPEKVQDKPSKKVVSQQANFKRAVDVCKKMTATQVGSERVVSYIDCMKTEARGK